MSWKEIIKTDRGAYTDITQARSKLKTMSKLKEDIDNMFDPAGKLKYIIDAIGGEAIENDDFTFSTELLNEYTKFQMKVLKEYEKSKKALEQMAALDYNKPPR
jgi:fatty acid-binding protein DegV